MKEKLFKLGVIALLGLLVLGCGNAQKADSQNEKVIPAAPHKIDDAVHQDCLSCHKDGKGNAKKTKHPDRPNCVGCHKSEVK